MSDHVYDEFEALELYVIKKLQNEDSQWPFYGFYVIYSHMNSLTKPSTFKAVLNP